MHLRKPKSSSLVLNIFLIKRQYIKNIEKSIARKYVF